MRLHRLHISGFGGLREVTVDLGDGITVLLGPNEAGKSTVLHCLSQVLMGKPTQRSNFPDFVPWDGPPFAAALEFEAEGERYRLMRRFDESGTRAVHLHRLCDDGSELLVTQEASEVKKRLSAALGTADDRIFYRVYCLTQADLTPLDNFSGLRERLERVVSGTEVAVTAAVSRIDERLSQLRKGVSQPALSQNWGALKRAEEARRDWEARLHEARRQQRRLTDARGILAQLQQQIADGETRIALIAGMLEEDRRRRDLLARLAELRTAWSAVEGERERVERLGTDRARMQELLDHLPPLFADPATLRTRLSVLQQGPGISAKLGWTLIALGLLATGLLFTFTHHPASLCGALLGGVAGIPMVLQTTRHTRGVITMCHDLRVQTLEEAFQRLEAAERYRRELDATTLALTAVSDGAQLQERRQQLAMDIAASEETIRQIPGTPLSMEDAHRLDSERRNLQAALPDLKEKERNLGREAAVLEEAERDLIDLEDGVAYWQHEEARAREEEQRLLLARELLLEAGQQAHESFAEPLAACISPLFATMTGGRYAHVCVEGDAKSFQVHPLDANGIPVPPDQLSRGTADQFVLAVRLALGQVIAGVNGSPIFLLDDPLLHFDAERRTEALAMLTQLSHHAQIILATHDPSIVGELPDAMVVRMDSGFKMQDSRPETQPSV